MPNKVVTYLIAEVQELKEAFNGHIAESGNIKTDIKWLKWFVMGIAGGIGTLLVLAIVAFINYVLKK